MKVLACSSIGISTKNLNFTNNKKHDLKTYTPEPELQSQFEFDYGKCLKQMCYILGITATGICGIAMAIKSKKKPL